MGQYTTDYNTLVALITDYVEDDSSEFSGMIQGAINRGEERVIRDLDISIFNTIISGSTGSGSASFTKTFTDTHVHTILLTATQEYVQRRTLDFVKAHGGSGRPKYYYEDQTKVYWAPVPDASYNYDLVYLRRPTKLSVSNTTNWITSNAADALMWASLVESESFLVSPERVSEFEAKYQQMLGPLRGMWRHQAQESYEPVAPAVTPSITR